MASPSPPFLSREWGWELSLSPPFQKRTGMTWMSPPFPKQECELGAQLVAAFSEAHRYELNVAAVSKAGMGTRGSACRRCLSGAQIIIQLSRRFLKRECEVEAQTVSAILVAHRYFSVAAISIAEWDCWLSLSPPFSEQPLSHGTGRAQPLPPLHMYSHTTTFRSRYLCYFGATAFFTL